MNPADYKCKCGHITEYDKPYGVEFPKHIKCSKCGSEETRKLFNGKIHIPEIHRATHKDS